MSDFNLQNIRVCVCVQRARILWRDAVAMKIRSNSTEIIYIYSLNLLLCRRKRDTGITVDENGEKKRWPELSKKLWISPVKKERDL